MYLEFFQLKEKPFNVTPDPAFLYMSPSHQEAFANLLYGIREKKGFVVLTGEVGTGKTTLLHNLLGTLGDEVLTVYVFHTGLEFDEMLSLVHQELSIPLPEDPSRASLIQSLNGFLIEQLRQDRNVAIIIDEAQNLSTEFLENLRLLSNLETAKDKLLQILLVGQPELDGKLSLPEIRQLNSRIAVRGRIEHLSPEESEAYILHRLNLAGAGLTPIFDDEALKLLCRHGGGIPRRLNMLADNALLIAFAEGERLVKGSHVRECLRDMERRDRPSPPPLEPSEEKKRRGAWWPWLLFVLLAATALVVMAYQFGITRSTLEPAPAPVEAPAEVMIEDTTPPPDESVPADSVALDAGAMALQDSLPPAEPDSLALAPADSIAPNPAEPSEDSGSIPAEALASSTYSPSLESRLELRERMRDSRMVAYRVVPGDQFNRLAERISGRRDPLFLSELRLMNPHIQDFDRILPGWILYFPKLEEKP